MLGPSSEVSDVDRYDAQLHLTDSFCHSPLNRAASRTSQPLHAMDGDNIFHASRLFHKQARPGLSPTDLSTCKLPPLR